MKPSRTDVFVGIAGVVACVVTFACQEPTEIRLEITTDIQDCTSVETAIAAGSPADVATRDYGAGKKKCDSSTGRIGSIVLVPSDGDGDEIGLRVVTALGEMTPESCADAQYIDENCIVQRRRLSFVPHTPLTLPIAMDLECRNKPCTDSTTCRKGECVSQDVPKPNQCALPGGCTGAGGTGGTSGTGGTDTDGGSCAYPPGPYGVDVGMVLPPGFEWQGLPANSAVAGSVSVQEFLDCDGSRNVNALLLVSTHTQDGSGPNEQEAATISNKLGAWQDAGIRVVFLLLDGAGGPPMLSDAQAWRSTFGLTGAAVVTDPSWSLVFDKISDAGALWTPHNTLVDPRQMSVKYRLEGFGDLAFVETLAAANDVP